MAQKASSEDPVGRFPRARRRKVGGNLLAVLFTVNWPLLIRRCRRSDCLCVFVLAAGKPDPQRVTGQYRPFDAPFQAVDGHGGHSHLRMVRRRDPDKP